MKGNGGEHASLLSVNQAKSHKFGPQAIRKRLKLHASYHLNAYRLRSLLYDYQGRVDESRSTKPWRILCEVYAKLLAMLVQHGVFLVSFWAYPDRSLTKAAQTVQKYALHLASAFTSVQRLGRTLLTVKRCLAAGCRMNRRKKHPHTYQLLLQATGP